MKFRPLLILLPIFVFTFAGFAQNAVNPAHLSINLSANGNVSGAAIRPSVMKTSDVAAPTAIEQSIEKQAFQLLNSERAKYGLSSLEWNDTVAEVARLHSQNMGNFKFFNHKGMDGLMVDDRADNLGLDGWRAIGENIAYMKGFKNPVETAVEKWMQSSSHKQNLLNDQWRESAVGVCVTEDGTYYFTQVFIVRK